MRCPPPKPTHSDVSARKQAGVNRKSVHRTELHSKEKGEVRKLNEDGNSFRKRQEIKLVLSKVNGEFVSRIIIVPPSEILYLAFLQWMVVEDEQRNVKPTCSYRRWLCMGTSIMATEEICNGNNNNYYMDNNQSRNLGYLGLDRTASHSVHCPI